MKQNGLTAHDKPKTSRLPRNCDVHDNHLRIRYGSAKKAAEEGRWHPMNNIGHWYNQLYITGGGSN